jgi:hypothetical protein
MSIQKYGRVVLCFFHVCMTYGMVDEQKAYRKKVRELVLVLHPEMLHKPKELEHCARSKEVEWRDDFIRALENADVQKAKIYLEVNLFPLFEADLARAYKNKQLGMMDYFFEYRVQRYERKTLVEKGYISFFSFTTMEQHVRSKQNAQFDLFFKTFESYFWAMRFFKNSKAFDSIDQVAVYNDWIRMGFIRGDKLEDEDAYEDTYYNRAKDIYRDACGSKKEYLIRSARIFKHEDVVWRFLKLHMPMGFTQSARLCNVHLRFQ